MQWCSVSPACRPGCRSLPESIQGREVCSGAVSHLPVALGAEACRRADRGVRCAVVQCLTCLSPWVQKPAGEQTGARGVQWCSVSPACRPGCRSQPESRQGREVCSGAVVQCLTCLSPWVQKPAESRQGREVCSGAMVQCLTCLPPWVQKPAGEQTGARGVQWCSVSPAYRPGCRSLPESRQGREVCSGAVVQCIEIDTLE